MLLAPFSLVWAVFVFLKNAYYDFGWKKPHRVHSVVVSVGNIVAGGTGKTPFIHRLALAFSHRKVAILSRGYGQIPDEAMLLQRRLPFARVYIGKDRVALAKIAEKDGAELILLDDGFQHRRLHRDVDIVLMTERNEKHYIPWGFLRDSPRRLFKADALFTKGKDFRLEVTRIVNAQGVSISNIQGWKVGLFCGLGNPDSFKQTVKGLGASIVNEWILADHEPACIDRLQLFCCQCALLGAVVILTTEKDFIKLPMHHLPIFYVEIEIGPLEKCLQWNALIAKISQKIDNFQYLGK